MLLVQNLKKHFPIKGGPLGRAHAHVKAMDGVSFDVRKDETLGIVGEPGRGKSTAARLLIRLIEPDAGTVVLDGRACCRGAWFSWCARCAARSKWCARTAMRRSTRA